MPEPGPGEVLIRIDAALTDGTDAKCYLRGHPVLLGETPSPFGHEYAGTVAAVGAGHVVRRRRRRRRRQLRALRRVRAAACAGREELCTELFPLLNGAYAEYLLVPERIARTNLYPLPEGVEPAVGAMCEPLACALHGVEATEARAGDRVCVLGRGALGQMLAAALAARGCDVVTAGVGRSRPAGRVRPRDRGGRPAGGLGARRPPRRARRDRRAVRRAEGRHLGAGRRLPAALRGADAARRLPPRAPPRAGRARAAWRRDPAPFRALITHEFALADVVVPLEMTAGIRPRDGLLKALIRP